MLVEKFRKFWFKITNWESWHYHLKYIPIAPFWLWYSWKARSFWFFTASNPTITFGGLDGEGKREIYAQLPEDSYPKSIFIQPRGNFEAVKNQIAERQIDLPCIVKPDIGAMGYLFRKIHSLEQLEKYHHFMEEEYIIQDWIDYPLEIGVFYYRMPGERKGVISGMLTKEPPAVTGDGHSTLQQLIENNKMLQSNYPAILRKHQDRLAIILPVGEVFVVSDASNRSQGANLKNLNHEIDEKLCRVFDEISLHSKSFFYGRFDVKCKSLEALKEGKDFSILEYNGSGAGIQHVYGNNLSLFQACKMIVHHWRKLYEISDYNHKERKIAYWKFGAGRKFLAGAMQHLKKLKAMEAACPV